MRNIELVIVNARMISKVLPGEFLSRAVNAVALVDTANLGEVYNAVAAIRIGRWSKLKNSGRSSWNGGELETGRRLVVIDPINNISSTKTHVTRTPCWCVDVIVVAKAISKKVIVTG